jgi:hypothetical protein
MVADERVARPRLFPASERKLRRVLSCTEADQSGFKLMMQPNTEGVYGFTELAIGEGTFKEK